jgi:hypothetical protein
MYFAALRDAFPGCRGNIMIRRLKRSFQKAQERFGKPDKHLKSGSPVTPFSGFHLFARKKYMRKMFFRPQNAAKNDTAVVLPYFAVQLSQIHAQFYSKHYKNIT